MSKNEKVNAYNLEKKFFKKVAEKKEVAKTKKDSNSLLKVLLVKVANRINLAIQNRRVLTVTMVIVTFSMAVVSAAVFLKSYNITGNLAFILAFIMAGLSTFIIMKSLLWLLPKQKVVNTAPKAKAQNPEEQVKNMIMMQQLMKG